MKKEIDIQMSTKVLYDYMLYHMYTSFTGIVGVVIGILFIVAFCSGMGAIYLVAGCIIIGYLPWSLFLKAANQMKTIEVFKNPLHYVLDEEGITISQGESADLLAWDMIVKAISTNQSIILYTSKVNATILPKSQIKDELGDIIQIISTHMPPSKVNIKG